ncbi:IQ motif and ankyrin repeat domain-containing protein 1 [Nematostella vectensis]|uniref:IQ motif and ankyrin repeat domain-containing protein 1 n=1 Tax=Nematostella vectensis TaxID=45351 RepID=UPI002076DB6E|nr:IQ motif and ankyrin repeat domain-containing protein 1 [Nematostella vectensis]
MPPKKSTPVAKSTARGTTKIASKPATTTRKPTTSKTATEAGPTGKGVASKKPTAAGIKGKAKAATSPQPMTLVWTKQDDSARTIQKYIRRHLAKKQLEKLKDEKQNYEEMMEKLQKEAWLKIVQMEREQAEKERQKEEEERKRRKEEAKRRARILEAAFDGDNDEILAVLEETYTDDQKRADLSDVARESLTVRHQLALVDCEDANNNTPLSEAASGGHSDTILMLINKGAEINSRGKYHRTPIWRAAFAGHLQAVQTLLENGGDPRLVADDGTNATQVASIPAVEQILTSWDLARTDALLDKVNTDRERKLEEESKRQKLETNRLEDEIKEAEKYNDACQKELTRAYCELNKRIFEHDSCMEEGKLDKKEITIQAIHDAEAVLELVKKKAEASKEKLSKAKLKLREQIKQDKKGESEENLQGIKVMIRDLDDVLFRDVGGKIAAGGRWPLLIDPSGQAAMFLRYRDTNYINALNPTQVEPEVIRLALLGAIRFGKPFVLDMMEVDMFDTMVMKFDDVQKGLLPSIMDKGIFKDNMFLKLVKPDDGEQYSKTAFLGARIENFMLVIITKQWNPPEKLMEQTYPIRIIIPSLPDF